MYDAFIIAVVIWGIGFIFVDPKFAPNNESPAMNYNARLMVKMFWPLVLLLMLVLWIKGKASFRWSKWP